MSSRSEQGRLAEDHALEQLRQAGLRLVERNYRSRFGEIDLIMADGPTLVFVEVRYRRSDRHGSAAESVDRAKQRRLARTAACFLMERRLNRPARFDVAALSPGPDGPRMNWIRHAFMAE